MMAVMKEKAMKKMRKGSAVVITAKYNVDGSPWRGPKRGTVTQMGRHNARVLFPIRKFVWLPKDLLKVVGYDGDGSSVHWR